MDATTHVPLDPDQLNPTDRAILDELRRARSTPAYIAQETGYSAGNVRNRMSYLASHDHVEAIGGGLYRLVDDPRSDPAGDPVPTRERAAIDAPPPDVVDGLKDLRVYLDAALRDLPEDVPGWTAVEDARRTVGELLDEYKEALDDE